MFMRIFDRILHRIRSVRTIQSLSTEELLEKFPDVTFHSRLFRGTIVADIFESLGITSTIHVFESNLKDLCVLSGIKYRTLTSVRVKDTLKSIGIPYKYMTDITREAALVWYYYEHKIEPPHWFWYLNKSNITTLRQLCPSNMAFLFNTYIDITVDEYLSLSTRPWKNNQGMYDMIIEMQDENTLRDMLRVYKIVCMNHRSCMIYHLLKHLHKNFNETILKIAKDRWENTHHPYLVENFTTIQSGQLPLYQRIPTNLADSKYMLHIPPSRFEFDIVESIILRHESVESFCERFDVTPAVLRWSLMDIDYNPSIEGILQSVTANKKDVLRLSFSKLRNKLHILDNYSHSITASVLGDGFRLLHGPLPKDCDFYDSPFVEDQYIGYGPITNLTVYSFDDLRGAFFDGIFRKPDEPSEIFYLLEIQLLIDLMKDSELKTQIQNMYKVSVAKLSLVNLSNQDKPIMKALMLKIFEAGMYQRTWKGPGTPYPLKYYQTNQNEVDIPVNMTPVLYEILDLSNKLSVDGTDILNNLHTLNINGKSQTYLLMNIVRKVISAEFCIAVASTMFVISAYYYLKRMGDPISGFNIYDFDCRTTDRHGLL